jgi:2,4-dienoyl-CoA reductase-like NADH-dependent reductase (Old Yellow Enzyme family)
MAKSKARHTVHGGRRHQNRHILDTVLTGVRGREISALLAEFYSKQADAFATLRDVSGCTAATSNARTHIEYLAADDDLPYLYWVTPAEITAYAGQRLLQLGHAGQETTLLDDGIALFDESSTRINKPI